LLARTETRMTDQLSIDQDHQDHGRAFVVPRGALDVNSSSQLRSALVETVEAGTDALVVDLREVTFVDSAGFSALMTAAKRLHARHGHLVLISTDESVVRMLRIMGLTDVMPLVGTPELAWAALAQL
jgi:anti-sigma B factor antagonist